MSNPAPATPPRVPSDADLRERARRDQIDFMARLGPRRPEYLAEIETSIHPGYRFPWRIAECPGTAPRALVERDVAAARAVLAAFDDARLTAARAEAPERYRRPAGPVPTPRFAAVDFQRLFDPATGAITRAFPEAQSFPGNMLLKPTKLEGLRRFLPAFDESCFFLDRSWRTFDEYRARLRAVAAEGATSRRSDGSPADFVVLEVRPLRQATVVDMLLWCRLLDAPLVDVLDLEPDPVDGELRYRRAVEMTPEGPRLREYDRPRTARRVLSRCIPPELDALIEEAPGGFDERRVRAIFQESLLRGAATFLVHPEDFFLVCKHTLIGVDAARPGLRRFSPDLFAALAQEGLSPEDGVVKPAYFAGGRGVRGVSTRLAREELRREAERAEAARLAAPDALTRLRETWLWQPRYGCDPLSRDAVPGFRPPTPDDAGPVYQEIRFMWMSETPPGGGPVRWTPLVGMTRWSRVGDPANASYQKTAFTGTQGYWVAPD
jgi:hypothetical protein